MKYFFIILSAGVFQLWLWQNMLALGLRLWRTALLNPWVEMLQVLGIDEQK
jgi:hypothetical protein